MISVETSRFYRHRKKLGIKTLVVIPLVDIFLSFFSQAYMSIYSELGGKELGLAISRNLAAIIGGAPDLEITPGKCSAFVLTLSFSI